MIFELALELDNFLFLITLSATYSLILLLCVSYIFDMKLLGFLNDIFSLNLKVKVILRKENNLARFLKFIGVDSSYVFQSMVIGGISIILAILIISSGQLIESGLVPATLLLSLVLVKTVNAVRKHIVHP